MVFVFTNCRKNAFRIELKLNPSSAAVFCASSLTFGSVLIKIVAVFIVLRSIVNIYPLSRKHTKIKVLQPDAVPIIQGYRYLGNAQNTCISHAWHIHVRTKPLADSLVKTPLYGHLLLSRRLSRHPTLARSQ